MVIISEQDLDVHQRGRNRIPRVCQQKTDVYVSGIIKKPSGKPFELAIVDDREVVGIVYVSEVFQSEQLAEKKIKTVVEAIHKAPGQELESASQTVWGSSPSALTSGCFR